MSGAPGVPWIEPLQGARSVMSSCAWSPRAFSNVVCVASSMPSARWPTSQRQRPRREQRERECEGRGKQMDTPAWRQTDSLLFGVGVRIRPRLRRVGLPVSAIT